MMTRECKSATHRLAEVARGIRGDIKGDSLPNEHLQVYDGEMKTEASHS